MADAEQLSFVCPECEERIDVNRSMREALLESGCVVCGTAVTSTAFSPRE